jgi:hypothetical protein
MTSRFQTAIHELHHAAAGAVHAHMHDLTATLHISVERQAKADGTLGNCAFSGQHSARLTAAAAVGPLAGLPEDRVATAIRRRNPQHECLSDSDMKALADYAKNYGAPVDLLPGTWLLLKATGQDRLSSMALTICKYGYVELPLFDVFPRSRIAAALKSVSLVIENAKLERLPLDKPLPARIGVTP